MIRRSIYPNALILLLISGVLFIQNGALANDLNASITIGDTSYQEYNGKLLLNINGTINADTGLQILDVDITEVGSKFLTNVSTIVMLEASSQFNWYLEIDRVSNSFTLEIEYLDLCFKPAGTIEASGNMVEGQFSIPQSNFSTGPIDTTCEQVTSEDYRDVIIVVGIVIILLFIAPVIYRKMTGSQMY